MRLHFDISQAYIIIWQVQRLANLNSTFFSSIILIWHPFVFDLLSCMLVFHQVAALVFLAFCRPLLLLFFHVCFVPINLLLQRLSVVFECYDDHCNVVERPLSHRCFQYCFNRHTTILVDHLTSMRELLLGSFPCSLHHMRIF